MTWPMYFVKVQMVNFSINKQHLRRLLNTWPLTISDLLYLKRIQINIDSSTEFRSRVRENRSHHHTNTKFHHNIHFITVIQIYAPTSSYDDSEIDEFYRELQSLVDQTSKQDILVVQGDWNAKVGEDSQGDWGEVYGPSCHPETNDRGLKLLDFAVYNNLVLPNTLGNHKPSWRWTWHSPDGTHHNQID